ncbi:MAG TPA: hypothetical protein VGM46_11060 [Mesorhizobium sp.]|jgi:hypothetical protein
MTPQELAKKHPVLYHITSAGAAKHILARGLLTTSDILDRWEVEAGYRLELTRCRRKTDVTLHHPDNGVIVVSNNEPLSELKLQSILDDGLTSGDWLEMLNSRVFFFVDQKQLSRLANSRSNSSLSKDVLVIDTKRLADAYFEKIEISPINSGNTNYDAVRRGRSTFTKLRGTSFELWRYSRGNKSADKISEVCIPSSILDVTDFVVEIREAKA